MNSNLNGEKGAADCGSFFLKQEKNLNSDNAKQIDFCIKTETAKNGKEILSINGKAVHSRFAPEKEAAAATAILQNAMENVCELSVPLNVSISSDKHL
jgi:hypothetical protein